MKTNKALLIIILITGSFLSAISQETPPGKKIKSIIVLEERHDALVKKQYKESETYYDPRGNVIETISYKQGRINKHFKYQYDQENNKIREEEYNATGDMIEFSEYKYENGLRVEKVVYTPDRKIKLRKVYQYTTF